MEHYIVKQPDTVAEIEKNIQCGYHTSFHVLVETPVVFVHKERQVDAETCAAMGYEVYEALYNGGTIVGNTGDIAFAHFGELDNGWMGRFVAYFVDWLKTKGLNAEYVSNDIVVDGFKVCGLCVTRYGRIDYTAGFICLTANLDRIKAICKKPMKKIPKGLSDYGITTEEVEKMFLNFCEREAAEK